MDTLQGIMDQIRTGQGRLHDLGARPASEAARPEAGAAPGALPSLSARDELDLAFNPAQYKPGDLESAHKPLDPARVARLLGLSDEAQS